MPGSIPAWAGEPSPRVVERPICGLSPRGRGNRNPTAGESPHPGLSPRGRGNRVPWVSPRASIPRKRVYPRVGGGTGTKSRQDVPWGLSPRGRGNPCTPVYSPVGEPLSQTGLSPRGRGNPSAITPHLPGPEGLSPRGRGNHPLPSWQPVVHWSTGVYPRVGGGTAQCNGGSGTLTTMGLSPRGRGNRGHIQSFVAGRYVPGGAVKR